MTRVVLSEAQREAVARGEFVRVAGAWEGFLVGRVAGAWRAYSNVCRHRALPLDLGANSPMSDDRRYLLCHQHGALYRLDDGKCVMGPCAGDSLEAVGVIEGTDGALVLTPPTLPVA
ncbi:MAG TPA: Rieske 2Fe-2S domain-containing protein [Polyangiaceae bacterium]|jgi:nitrite reductase/ring-hydroxylating ferredoxin subunit